MQAVASACDLPVSEFSREGLPVAGVDDAHLTDVRVGIKLHAHGAEAFREAGIEDCAGGSEVARGAGSQWPNFPTSLYVYSFLMSSADRSQSVLIRSAMVSAIILSAC